MPQGTNRPQAPNNKPGGGKPPYDPAKYETVNDRIKRFYADNPGGRIVAALEGSSAADLSTVVIRAEVFLTAEDQAGKLPKGTGLASETYGVGSFANNGSHIENCETSAIGRALANAGYSGKLERATREEMEKATRFQQPEPPRHPTPAGSSQAINPQELTPRQQRAEQARQDRNNPPAAPDPGDDEIAAGEAPPGASLACNQCGKPLTQSQYTIALKNFGIPLCPPHQQEAKNNINAGG